MKNNKKNIIIIGSTGSVGKNAIEIINLNSSKFNVIALVAKQNTKLLVQQAFLTNCKYVIVEDKNKYNDLKTDIENLNLSKINILAGVSDILDIINNAPKDSMVFLASLGAETLIYLHCAMENNLEIAIANKESIVCGGDFLKDKLNNYSNKIIPVDSEHSAIFQLLDNKNKKNINKILITASGGPFFDLPINEFKNITLQKALKHPIWSMGNKITIDSATLMNKALEVIEACYLFNIDPIKIEVLVDQKAILHGGVFYNDGTFLANFSNPHMKIPISYALNYPNRLNTNISNIT
jgi:1-deoxy-D-xylulose-5-phosphate reductoisomerase